MIVYSKKLGLTSKLSLTIDSSYGLIENRK